MRLLNFVNIFLTCASDLRIALLGFVSKFKKSISVLCFFLATIFSFGLGAIDSPSYALMKPTEKIVSFKSTSFNNLKNFLSSGRFNKDSAKSIIENLRSVLGANWYDQNAKITLNYMMYGGTLYIKRANFSSTNRFIQFKCQDSFCRMVKQEKFGPKLLAIKGFVSNSFDSVIRKGDIPSSLRIQAINFARSTGFNISKGSSFSFVYCPSSNKINAMFLRHPSEGRRSAIAYKVHGKTMLFSLDGRSLSVQRRAFRMPVRGRISGVFGMRLHPIARVYRMHGGMDIAAVTGTPIFAAAPGVVTFVGRNGGYGRCIIIRHGKISTLYAHLNAYARGLKVGDRIGSNKAIGTVGSSGYSTAPHLHYEVHVSGRRVNPVGYFKEARYVLSGQEKANFGKLKNSILRVG